MPQPVLAAVVIAASISLFDLRRAAPPVPGAAPRVRARRGVRAWAWPSWASSRASSSPWCCRSIYIFKRAWQPYSTVLGKDAGRRRATTTSGATRMRGRCRACSSCAGRRRCSSPTRTCSATASASSSQASDPPPRWVLVAAEPITDIDTTAGAMLADLDLELNAPGIHLAFAELQSDVRDAIVALRPAGDHRPGSPLPVRERGGRGIPERRRARAHRPRTRSTRETHKTRTPANRPGSSSS